MVVKAWRPGRYPIRDPGSSFPHSLIILSGRQRRLVVKAWRPGRYPISRGLQTPVMMGPSPSNNIWMLEEIGSKGRAAWKVSNLKRAPDTSDDGAEP